MSIRFNGTDQYLYRAPGWITIPSTSGHTVGGWFKIHTLPAGADYDYIVSMWSSGWIGWGLFIGSDGKLGVRDYNTGTNGIGTTVIAVDTWHYVWIRPDATGGYVRIHLDGAAIPEIVRWYNIDTTPNISFAAGRQPDAGGYCDCTLAGWKAWCVAQNFRLAGQYGREERRWGTTRLDPRNLRGEWHFDTASDIRDRSRHGADLTAYGTPTTGADSPGLYRSNGPTLGRLWGLKPAESALATNQYSYRWRNDDGDEDGASWLTTLNTRATLTKGQQKRLRILIDTSGQQSTGNYQLEYRRKGASTFKKIPVD